MTNTRSSRGFAERVITGDVFGYWTVTGSYVRKGLYNQAYFPCRCRCGTEREVIFRSLQRSRRGTQGSYSCGCYQKEVMASRRRHGEPGTKEYNRSRYLWTSYRMTPNEYDQMLVTQDGHCWICPSTEELFVDHCHKTGKVRAILCRGCNVALGHFKENPLTMAHAIRYLIEIAGHPAEVND